MRPCILPRVWHVHGSHAQARYCISPASPCISPASHLHLVCISHAQVRYCELARSTAESAGAEDERLTAIEAAQLVQQMSKLQERKEQPF